MNKKIKKTKKQKAAEPTLSVLQLKQLVVGTLHNDDRLKTLVCCKGATGGLEGIWDLEPGTIPGTVEWAAYIVTGEGDDVLLILHGENWIKAN